MHRVHVCVVVLPLTLTLSGRARAADTVPADWWTCDTAGADGMPVGWTRVGARGDVTVDRQVKVQGTGSVRFRHDATHRRTVIRSAGTPVGERAYACAGADRTGRRVVGGGWQTLMLYIIARHETA